jgi:hypothetical protein
MFSTFYKDFLSFTYIIAGEDGLLAVIVIPSGGSLQSLKIRTIASNRRSLAEMAELQ